MIKFKMLNRLRGRKIDTRMGNQTMGKEVTAALLVIGDEILSGRTQDANTQYLAGWLNEAGIQLREVRVVPDATARIIAGVNELRSLYDYLFTTGGIGPTHDDITAEAVAKAFGLPLVQHPDAYNMLLAHYGEDDFTKARQRMTRVPDGASLISNSVSLAPGFQIDNVFVLAGVPKIMQVMLEDLRPRLESGEKILSWQVTVHMPESAMASELDLLQTGHELVSVGSYPFYSKG